ncbi:MAG: TonB-dependent receptor, partial [Methylococcales bacterium]
MINIITKHSEDTQGGLLSAGGGTQETGFGALRYGTKLANDTYARVYGKGFSRDAFATQKATNGSGDWSQYQGGMRVDSTLTVKDSLMVQANAYQGQPNQNLETFLSPTPVTDQINTSGWNMTSRFNHTISSTADYSLQFYYDHYQREEFVINNRRDTLDLDFQNNFAYGDKQNFIWGLGYRYTTDLLRNQPFSTFNPNKRNTQLFSAFMQDEIRLMGDALLLTLGSKFEHNDYTGFQVQPSISAIWTPVAGHKIWGSISRAVRTPSRAEHNSKILISQYPAFTEDNPY